MQSTLGSLTSDKLIEPNATDLKGFGLRPADPRCLVMRKDGKTDRLLIGGRYADRLRLLSQAAGDARVFTVASTVKKHLDKRPDDLRDQAAC